MQNCHKILTQSKYLIIEVQYIFRASTKVWQNHDNWIIFSIRYTAFCIRCGAIAKMPQIHYSDRIYNIKMFNINILTCYKSMTKSWQCQNISSMIVLRFHKSVTKSRQCLNIWGPVWFFEIPQKCDKIIAMSKYFEAQFNCFEFSQKCDKIMKMTKYFRSGILFWVTT